MKIDAPCVLSLSWTLSDAQGEVIDELAEPVEFFYGGSDLLSKVEEALLGHEAGHETHLHLEPEIADGVEDRGLVRLHGRYDDAADAQRLDPFVAQSADEFFRRRRPLDFLCAGVGAIK